MPGKLGSDAEAALAEAISDFDTTDAGSVAAILDAINSGEAVGNLDSPVSEAGGGVEWSSKTPFYVFSNAGTAIPPDDATVSGSGYVTFVEVTGSSNYTYSVDDTPLLDEGGFNETKRLQPFHRFESSATLSTSADSTITMVLVGVLD